MQVTGLSPGIGFLDFEFDSFAGHYLVDIGLQPGQLLRRV